eukprot:gene12433-biopygen13324
MPVVLSMCSPKATIDSNSSTSRGYIGPLPTATLFGAFAPASIHAGVKAPRKVALGNFESNLAFGELTDRTADFTSDIEGQKTCRELCEAVTVLPVLAPTPTPRSEALRGTVAAQNGGMVAQLGGKVASGGTTSRQHGAEVAAIISVPPAATILVPSVSFRPR